LENLRPEGEFLEHAGHSTSSSGSPPHR
jgi:hypothetical protein